MTEYRQRKILYIEDDTSAREMIAEILKEHGFKFYGASRSLEGIRIATEVIPDLILMDINLPDMDGYETTTLLKSVKNLENTPIVALSAVTEAQARERILAAGCQGFISKPVLIDQFITQINEYLQGKRETLTADIEKKQLTEYNIRLGEKLQNKIAELEKVNQSLKLMNEELNVSKNQLTDYNNRLYAMNNIANDLRIQGSPGELLQILPAKIVEGFGVDRCLVFEFDDESQKLDLIYAEGLSEKQHKKIRFNLDISFYEKLKRELKVLWVQDSAEIPDANLTKMARELNSPSFLIASLTGFSSRQDATSIFQSIAMYVDNASEENHEITKPRRYIIFIDRGRTNIPFASYEIRVLKAFLQTASIIYENMMLYHKLMKLYRIKEQEAFTDPLTNVFNYRYFQNEIEREIVRSSRHQSSVSVAIIDVDNFKQYNDTQGHLQGDEALKLVARTIINNIRKSDTLARYGGDEFIMILPELDKNQSKTLAEKLCNIVKKTKFPSKLLKPKVELTISLGIATYPQDGRTEEDLLRKADKALYTAKKLGRNQVCIAT